MLIYYLRRRVEELSYKIFKNKSDRCKSFVLKTEQFWKTKVP